MSRTPRYLAPSLALAAALAIAMSGAARADDSSMSRLGGDSYEYFNRMLTDAPATSGWRVARPNGLTDRELQALSSSSLSSFAPTSQPEFARVAADPAWRQSHPNGLTIHELQAFSGSSVSQWQARNQWAAAAPTAPISPVAKLRAGGAGRQKAYE